MSDLFAETGSAVYERLLDDGDPNLRLAGALLAPRAPDAARYVPRMLRLAVPARSDGAEGLLLDAIDRIGVSAEPGLMAALREGARKPDAIQSRRALCVLEPLGEGGTPCSQEALLAVVDALRTPHRLEEPGLQAAVEDAPVVKLINGTLTDAVKRGASVQACQVPLGRQKLEKAAMLPDIGYVPAGLGQIIKRQRDGWSYISG